MKINLVNVENGLQAIGFRKFAAKVKEINPDTNVYFVPPAHQFSLLNRIFLRSDYVFNDDDIRIISLKIANADMIGFSFMSECRDIARKIIKETKKINPGAIIVTGGAHSRIYPDDALSFSDIVCDGEGELAFEELYTKLISGREYYKTNGFHFNTGKDIITNPPRTPLSNTELENLPYFDFDTNNQHYDINKKCFIKTDSKAYMKWLGLNLNIIWTRGCPNKCAYCYNSSFIERHRDNAKIRYPSPRYIVNEIKSILKIHPMISWVSLIDDGMMAINYTKLKEFSDIYLREVRLPFLTYGAHPNYVREDKVKLLVESGTVFFRMGIQFCSEHVLEIYNRNTSLAKIETTCNILTKFKKYVTPSGFDVILDNFFTTIDERREHLKCVYHLQRPFIINLHSLRIVPGSNLEKNIKSFTDSKILASRDKNLLHVRNTVYNLTHYILTAVPVPHFIFKLILKYGCEDKKEYRAAGVICRFIYLVYRGLNNILKMDFSFVSGSVWFVPYLLWKTGVLKIYNKYDFNRRRKLDVQ